ncbi:MAG: SIMPL domain-containing protein [Phycisphaerales bacterium]|nr:SIMPL domain-containing protein [Phycisphaerales bacterium]
MSSSRLNLFWLIIFGLTLPLSVVISTQLARRSFERVRIRGQTITVKGYAERDITSDLATWSARLVSREPELVAAYARLEENRSQLLAYLESKGFSAAGVALAPVEIDTLHAHDERGNATNAIESYVLTQRLSIESPQVETVAEAARDASALIGRGVELQANAPQYLYTKLDDLKLELLAEATANGRERAARLVTGSGNHVGALRGASQGVFQITPAYSTEVSSTGMNDTESLRKVTKAVVTLEYAID